MIEDKFEDVTHLFPRLTGEAPPYVYMLKQDGIIVYVGRTQEGNKSGPVNRIRRHQEGHDHKEFGKEPRIDDIKIHDEVNWLCMSDDFEAAVLEIYLRSKYKPIYNKEAPFFIRFPGELPEHEIKNQIKKRLRRRKTWAHLPPEEILLRRF